MFGLFDKDVNRSRSSFKGRAREKDFSIFSNMKKSTRIHNDVSQYRFKNEKRGRGREKERKNANQTRTEKKEIKRQQAVRQSKEREREKDFQTKTTNKLQCL